MYKNISRVVNSWKSVGQSSLLPPPSTAAPTPVITPLAPGRAHALNNYTYTHNWVSPVQKRKTDKLQIWIVWAQNICIDFQAPILYLVHHLPPCPSPQPPWPSKGFHLCCCWPCRPPPSPCSPPPLWRPGQPPRPETTKVSTNSLEQTSRVRRTVHGSVHCTHPKLPKCLRLISRALCCFNSTATELHLNACTWLHFNSHQVCACQTLNICTLHSHLS